jgi:hypothetical protein
VADRVATTLPSSPPEVNVDCPVLKYLDVLIGLSLVMVLLPNKLKASIHGKEDSRALTDPRTVYGLRWIAGRRLQREFAPPYTLH